MTHGQFTLELAPAVVQAIPIASLHFATFACESRVTVAQGESVASHCTRSVETKVLAELRLTVDPCPAGGAYTVTNVIQATIQADDPRTLTDLGHGRVLLIINSHSLLLFLQPLYDHLTNRVVAVFLNEMRTLYDPARGVLEAVQSLRLGVGRLVHLEGAVIGRVHDDDALLLHNQTGQFSGSSIVQHSAFTSMQVRRLNRHFRAPVNIDPEHFIRELVDLNGHWFLQSIADQHRSLIEGSGVVISAVERQRSPFDCRPIVAMRRPVEESAAHVQSDRLRSLVVETQEDSRLGLRLRQVQSVDSAQRLVDPVQDSLQRIKGYSSDRVVLVNLRR